MKFAWAALSLIIVVLLWCHFGSYQEGSQSTVNSSLKAKREASSPSSRKEEASARLEQMARSCAEMDEAELWKMVDQRHATLKKGHDPKAGAQLFS